jgi:hypothetical protein
MINILTTPAKANFHCTILPVNISVLDHFPLQIITLCITIAFIPNFSNTFSGIILKNRKNCLPVKPFVDGSKLFPQLFRSHELPVSIGHRAQGFQALAAPSNKVMTAR